MPIEFAVRKATGDDVPMVIFRIFRISDAQSSFGQGLKYSDQQNSLVLKKLALKAEAGGLFLVSSSKNPIITFQHVVIQVV